MGSLVGWVDSCVAREITRPAARWLAYLASAPWSTACCVSFTTVLGSIVPVPTTMGIFPLICSVGIFVVGFKLTTVHHVEGLQLST